jgi:uncharacterized membrane protein YbhN (UPF0104 family)
MATAPQPRTVRERAGRVFVRVAPYVVAPLLAWYVWDRRHELDRAFQTSLDSLLIIMALVVVGMFLNAFEFFLLYRAVGVQIGPMENWALFNAGQLGNYLPMQVGTIYRFRYLKNVHGHRYSRNASNLAMNLVITLASTATCGLIGVLGSWITDDRDISILVPLAFLGLLVAGVVMATAPLPRVFRQSHHRVAAAWEEFHRGWEAMRRQPRVGAEVFLIDVAKLLVLALRFDIAFRILDVRAPFWLFLVLGPVAALAGVLAVTPGALGLREATVAAAAAGMGYGLPTGLLAATVDRGAMILVTVILGSTSYLWTRRAPRRELAAGGEGDEPISTGGRDDVGDDALE